MNKTIIITVVAVIIIASGLLYWYSRPTALAPNVSSGPTSQPTNTQPAGALNAPLSETVAYTDRGFFPPVITVKAGGAITWVNNSTEKIMWVASAVHPTHDVYSGTTLSQHCPDKTGSAFDGCSGIPPGGSWSFKFQKTGTWKYHNHLDASETGTAIVQ